MSSNGAGASAQPTVELPRIKEPFRGIYDESYAPVEPTQPLATRRSVTEQLWPAGAAKTPQRNSIARDTRPVVVSVAVALLTFAVLGLAFGLMLNRGGPSTNAAPTLAPPPPGPTSSATPSSQPSASDTPTSSGVVSLPEGATLCGDGAGAYAQVYVGNNATSCPFAQNVLAAYAAANAKPVPKATIVAESPVTNKAYTLNCVASDAGVVNCSGGSNARIILLPG